MLLGDAALQDEQNIAAVLSPVAVVPTCLSISCAMHHRHPFGATLCVLPSLPSALLAWTAHTAAGVAQFGHAEARSGCVRWAVVQKSIIIGNCGSAYFYKPRNIELEKSLAQTGSRAIPTRLVTSSDQPLSYDEATEAVPGITCQ